MQVQQDKINHNVLGLGFDIRLPVNSECLIKGKLQRKIKPFLNQIPGLGDKSYAWANCILFRILIFQQFLYNLSACSNYWTVHIPRPL